MKRVVREAWARLGDRVSDEGLLVVNCSPRLALPDWIARDNKRAAQVVRTESSYDGPGRCCVPRSNWETSTRHTLGYPRGLVVATPRR